MILFVDTETSGLIDFSLPVDHPSQPHIVQLAAILCEDDADCTVAEQFQAIVRPDGWEIQRGAEAIHHISEDYAFRFGESLEHVMSRFYRLVHDTTNRDFSGETGTAQLVAHNVTFDLRMILRATNMTPFNPRLVNDLRPFCTMRAMTSRCRLPSKHRGKFKWPRLEEAYAHLFDRTPPAETAHTALGDSLACRDIFVEGRRREWWR